MARTAEAARRIQARKLRRARSTPMGFDNTWQMYRHCELCGKPYCCNNYADHKPRYMRWKGLIICAECRYKFLPTLKKAMDKGLVKYRKKYA
jgi:hypothetical protein